jgi:hypothetical protein
MHPSPLRRSAPTKELIKQHISTIVGRVNSYTGVAYKDDDAIMTWNVLNEPRWAGGRDGGNRRGGWGGGVRAWWVAGLGGGSEAGGVRGGSHLHPATSSPHPINAPLPATSASSPHAPLARPLPAGALPATQRRRQPTWPG